MKPWMAKKILTRKVPKVKATEVMMKAALANKNT